MNKDNGDFCIWQGIYHEQNSPFTPIISFCYKQCSKEKIEVDSDFGSDHIKIPKFCESCGKNTILDTEIDFMGVDKKNIQEDKKMEVKSKLRGKKPSDAEKNKRFKAFFYGPAGVGKTMTSIGFPKPYLIDTEKGAENSQYCKILNDNGGSIFQTSEFDELIKEVKILLSEKHDYKTLIIDPLTTIYNDLLDKSANSVGVEFGRHYEEANKHMKKLIAILLKLDMNVIITSHAKNEYGDGMKVIGSTFDCYKKLDYLFDLVLDIQKHGEKRIGMVKKSRIESFKENEHFNFSYESISEKYNKDIMERDSVPLVLATEEQISNIKHLIEAMNISSLVYSQWLSKEKCESFEEMRSESIQKCIDHLNKKVNNTTKDK